MKIEDYNGINSEHMIIIIKWLFDEVLSAGGDGDGIWYSRYFKLENIMEFIEKENLMPNYFDFRLVESSNEPYCIYSEGQESLIITNSKEMFNRRPKWQQVSLEY